MLSVVMLIVVMLGVVAPLLWQRFVLKNRVEKEREKTQFFFKNVIFKNGCLSIYNQSYPSVLYSTAAKHRPLSFTPACLVE
jgi:hypothetical protein